MTKFEYAYLVLSWNLLFAASKSMHLFSQWFSDYYISKILFLFMQCIEKFSTIVFLYQCYILIQLYNHCTFSLIFCRTVFFLGGGETFVYFIGKMDTCQQTSAVICFVSDYMLNVTTEFHLDCGCYLTTIYQQLNYESFCNFLNKS